MGKTIIAAIIVAIVLAGWAGSHHGSSPAPTPASSHASTAAVNADGVSAACQADGTPTDVHPDTAAARQKARSLCASANADAQTVASQLNMTSP